MSSSAPILVNPELVQPQLPWLFRIPVKKRSIRVLLVMGAIFTIVYLTCKWIYWKGKVVRHAKFDYPIPRYTFKSVSQLNRAKEIETDALCRLLASPVCNITISSMHKYNAESVQRLQAPPSANRLPESSKIAIVTMIALARRDQKIMAPSSVFKAYVPSALDNLSQYAHKHGYPFFHQTHHIINEEGYNLYWGKLDVVKHYMQQGFEWVVWTDIDVLIMDFDVVLQTFIRPAIESTQPGGTKYDFISWLEPAHHDWTPEALASSIRSGFFIVRNSPSGHEFMDHWSSLRLQYGSSSTPEQDALEAMSRDAKWKSRMLFWPTWILQTYPEAYEPGVWSVHFVNTERKWQLPVWAKLAPSIESDYRLDVRFKA